MQFTQQGQGRVLGTVLTAGLILCLAWRSSPAQESDGADYLPVQTSINALMVALVDHSAHEIWEAASDETLSASDWRTAEQHAIQLISSGTLIGSRVRLQRRDEL